VPVCSAGFRLIYITYAHQPQNDTPETWSRAIHLVFGVVCIFAVGVSLGLLGAGGTAIALPVLVYLVGMEAHLAVTVSIILVGAASAFGAILHQRRGNVRWMAALSFAPFGIIGAVLGARWSYAFSARALLLTFSGLLVIIAVRLLRDNGAGDGRKRPLIIIAVVGFGIGILTGLLGVGGGFVIVPSLVWFAGLAMKEAIGTSLVIIAINSAAAFYGHWRGTPDLEPGVVLPLLLSAGAGMALGSRLAHATDPARLRRWFAWLLIAMALYMAVRNLIWQ